MKFNTDALLEIAVLKDKKAPTTISRKVCISNNRDSINKNKIKKEHIRLVIVY